MSTSSLCQRLIHVAVTKQPCRCYVADGATYTPSNLGEICTIVHVFSTMVNMNRPDGATYPQMFYVPKWDHASVTLPGVLRIKSSVILYMCN